MVVVFDKDTGDTRKLLETIQSVDQEAKFVMLGEGGFLPDNVLSPYQFFVSGQNCERLYEKELFCNFLEVPEFWEIRSIDFHGAIYDMGCKKADIYFAEPTEKKIVQRVEWCMENGWIYKIDYYNKYAMKYASEFRDMDGNVESKVYYSAKNQEVIVEQPQNDTITLLENGTVKAFFTSYAEFLEYYFEKAGLGEMRTLFIQDNDGFRLLELKSGGESFWKSVLFSGKELLDKYIGMGGENGYRFYAIPKEYPLNEARGEALTLTSVDRLEGIEELVRELPEVIFHIAASTQVSDKLKKLGELPNVMVYPQISMQGLDTLWNTCDFYLDINYYWETYDAIEAAHWRNLLILGFEDTLHHRELVAEECIFSKTDAGKMISVLKELIHNTESVEKLLEKQQQKRQEFWRALRGVV